MDRSAIGPKPVLGGLEVGTLTGEFGGYSYAPLGDTLLLTVEDNPEDMIMPRFDAAGGDDRRIHIVQGVATRDEDRQPVLDMWDLKNIEKLEQWLDQFPDTLLIRLDPVGDFMPEAKGRVPDYNHVRRVLSRLAKLAAKRNIAIVSHSARVGLASLGGGKQIWLEIRSP